MAGGKREKSVTGYENSLRQMLPKFTIANVLRLDVREKEETMRHSGSC